MSAVLAIARTTARDGLRAPVTGVALFVGLALTLASPEVAIFTLGNARGFVLDLGASTVLLTAVFLAATTGALGAAERIQDGTALAILSKAVGPLEYVLGIFFGTAAVLVLAGWLLMLALVHAVVPPRPGTGWLDVVALAVALGAGVRASRAGRSFQVATLLGLAVTGLGAILGRLALGGTGPVLATAVLGVALAVLAGLAYAALGCLCAARLAPTLAAVTVLGAAVLGAALEGFGASMVGTVLGWVVPNLALFSIGDAAYAERGIPPLFVAELGGWTLLYAAGVLSIAAVLLGRRELG